MGVKKQPNGVTVVDAFAQRNVRRQDIARTTKYTVSVLKDSLICQRWQQLFTSWRLSRVCWSYFTAGNEIALSLSMSVFPHRFIRRVLELLYSRCTGSSRRALPLKDLCFYRFFWRFKSPFGLYKWWASAYKNNWWNIIICTLRQQITNW